MKKKVISVIKYALFLVAGIGMLWLTFRNQDFTQVIQKIENVHIGWLLASVVAAILAHLSRAIRWNMLITPLGYKPKLINTFWALCAGYFANLAVPRLGEITRCGMLTKAEQVPFNELFGTVIVERIMDVLMLFLLLLAVAALEFHLIGGFLYDTIAAPLMSKFQNLNLPLVAGALVIGIVAIFTYFYFSKHSGKSKAIFEKINLLLKGVVDGIKSIAKMKNKSLFIFHTLFIWVMYFFASYLCFFALDSTSMLDAKAGLFILVIGGLGMSAPVQGGIGAFHFIVSRGLMLYGISETEGIVYATIVHGYQTILVLVLGAIGFFVLMATGRRIKTNNGL